MTNPKGLTLAADYGRVVAPSNACPAKRPSLRACGAGVGFAGLGLSVYLHAYMRTFLMTNPKGLHIVADFGRVVAPLQRLPCQETKPKGLLGMFCTFTFKFIIALDQ